MSELCRVIRKRDCWSQSLGAKHLLIYHSGGSAARKLKNVTKSTFSYSWNEDDCSNEL